MTIMTRIFVIFAVITACVMVSTGVVLWSAQRDTLFTIGGSSRPVSSSSATLPKAQPAAPTVLLRDCGSQLVEDEAVAADEASAGPPMRRQFGWEKLQRPTFMTWSEEEVERYRSSPDAHFDIVYLWVNGTEGEFVQNRAKFGGPKGVNDRDRDNGELRFSLRSIDMYMPWWNGTLYFVHQNLPCWLDRSHPRLKLVHHRDIFEWREDTLPTFNSDAVEMFLHRIPGLSKVFVLMNDDFFLGYLAKPSDFIDQGRPVLWFEETVVTGGMVEYKKSSHGVNIDNFDLKLMHTKGILYQHYPDQARNHKFFQYKHAPFVMDKDRIATLWKEYPEVLQVAVRHRFRDPECVDMAFLHHHYCLLVDPQACVVVRPQRAFKDAALFQVGSLGSRLSSTVTSLWLDPPLFICLNDAQSSKFSILHDSRKEASKMYRGVLPRLYPYPSQWETTACPGPRIDF